MTRILVTGGAGYIGSHTVLQLLQNGDSVVVYDNFSNSKPEAMVRVRRLAAEALGMLEGRVPLTVVQGDIRDKVALTAAFTAHADVEAVIHFAGLKAVGESVAEPLRYYDNNVVGSVRLLEVMAEAGVHQLVFSSSATVYGDPHAVPITEDFPLHTTNPYGATKLHIEDMLRDLHRARPGTWRIAILRYFNPVGAHESGLIGEDPQGIPNNLMPFVAQVAIGRRECLKVWGNDYPTPDGTGVRDYIHVVDLANGHLKALARLSEPQCTAINLGTGVGYSVLEVINTFSRSCGRPVPYEVAPRRLGDVAACYADPSLAEMLLGWRAQKDLGAMCKDAWRWQWKNPIGFPGETKLPQDRK